MIFPYLKVFHVSKAQVINKSMSQADRN